MDSVRSHGHQLLYMQIPLILISVKQVDMEQHLSVSYF